MPPKRSSSLCLFLLLSIIFQAVASLPLLNLNAKAKDDEFMPDLDKRDIEEEAFLEPPESIAYLFQLPRTDRKNFETEAFLDALPDEIIGGH